MELGLSLASGFSMSLDHTFHLNCHCFATIIDRFPMHLCNKHFNFLH